MTVRPHRSAMLPLALAAVMGCAKTTPTAATCAPLEIERAQAGEPLSIAEVRAFTDRYLELLEATRYFELLAERAHGWPESDPEQRYWYGTWWSGVEVVKENGRITYLHGYEHGADNNGLRTAPLLEAACSAYALWGGAERERLVRVFMRGFTSWIMAMEREPGDAPLLARAAYPEPVLSTDGGREVFIDYGTNRPGEDSDTSQYVNVSSPHWGDLWVKNLRSKDDIGHMLRAMVQLESCASSLSDEAAAELEDMRARYAAWARRVEDDGWVIATRGKDGEVLLPSGLLARFVTWENVECDAMLALRLFAGGEPRDLDCGNGVGELDSLILAGSDSNGEILRSFHEAAASAALLTCRQPLARSLATGLVARIEEGLDQWEADDLPDHLGPGKLSALIIHAARVGVPLTAREVRFLHDQFDLASASYLDPALEPVYRVFDADVPDGRYPFTPDAEGLSFRTLGLLLGVCTSPWASAGEEKALDCERVRSWAPGP